MVRKVLGGILIYALFVYCLLMFGPQFDFYPLRITPASSAESISLFLLLGGVFWLIYDVIRYILKFVTIPLNALSFGLVHLVLNVAVLYLIPPIAALTEVETTINMGTILEVTIMAILLSIVGLIIKHL